MQQKKELNYSLDDYKKKADIYKLGIDAIKRFIKEYQVDCDWNECGKYFASSRLEDEIIIQKFHNILNSLNKMII